MSLQEYAQREYWQKDYGGQFASFDAVFSPRAEDGRPQKLFDRESGEINREVAESWKKYDICWTLKQHWETLGPKLQGKLHVYVGTLDTFRLEGAVKLLKQELEALGSDATIVLVEGRNHGDVLAPYDKLWPEGLLHMIHHQMWEAWGRGEGG